MRQWKMGRTCRGHIMSGKWYEDQGLLYYCWWCAGNPPRPTVSATPPLEMEGNFSFGMIY
jgi:hypothetical protein